MNRIIDFHSHILCGADHGSKSIDTSKAQLELMHLGKTAIAVATPHFYPDKISLEDFLCTVERSLNEMKSLAPCKSPELCIGAEVLLCDGLDRMEGLERLCIRGTRCMLLELPMGSALIRKCLDTVERIINSGYTVVLAHIDRYLKDNEEEIDALISMGALAQINAEGLASFFLKRKLMSYVDGGYVCALGSDLHGASPKDYKGFASLEKKLGAARFGEIMAKTEALLSDAERVRLG